MVGLALLAIGFLWISRLHVDSGYLPFLGGLVVAGAGIGLTSSTGTSGIVSALSSGQQGVASAVNDASREVGSAVGIALMGSIFGSAYASHLPSLHGLPPAAGDAVRQSPAAGLHVASQLGGAQGHQLGLAVQHAFIHGLSTSLVVVSCIVLVAAIGAGLRAPRSATR
jgi:hypothetical protein